MIQPLRAAHRLVFFACLLILPALFLGGLFARHKWPLASPANPVQLQNGEVLLSEKVEKVGNLQFNVRLLGSSGNPGERAVQISSKTPLVAPDVLVYWSEQPVPSALPAAAQLLGPYRPHARYLLPVDSRETGSIMLYSLGQQKLLGAFSLGKRP